MPGKVVVLMRQAPYGSVYPAEGFRAMMGLAVFEMELCVLLMDDGVYVLVKGQNPAQLEMKPLGEGFTTLGDFGITEIYVHDESLRERGLMPEDLVLPAQLVNSAQAAHILESASQVLPF